MSQQNTRFTLESDDEDAKLQQLRRGKLKIDSAKSQFTKNAIQQATQKEKFEQQADVTFDQIQNRKERAAELVQQFWSFVRDETLVSEKGPIKKNLEKETINKLLSFASELNNDPNESEGTGSVALITLLLKAVIHFRDANNESNYRLSEAEKKINKLSSQISALPKIG